MIKECRLCDMIDRIERAKELGNFEHWNQSLKIRDEREQIITLNLSGILYHTSKYDEIVRYSDDKVMFVNSIKKPRDYADIIIGMPIQHIRNQELTKKPELFVHFYDSAYDLINKQHNGNLKIILNEGEKYASVPQHSHIQLIQGWTSRLYIPAIRRNY